MDRGTYLPAPVSLKKVEKLQRVAEAHQTFRLSRSEKAISNAPIVRLARRGFNAAVGLHLPNKTRSWSALPRLVASERKKGTNAQAVLKGV